MAQETRYIIGGRYDWRASLTPGLYALAAANLILWVLAIFLLLSSNYP